MQSIHELSKFNIYWETSLMMMLSRIGVLITCLVVFQWMMMMSVHTHAAQVQPATNNASLYTQQAVTEVQVTQQAAELSRLRVSQEQQDSTIAILRDDLATVKGMGIGAVSVIGLLQALQIILQVRSVKKAS